MTNTTFAFTGHSITWNAPAIRIIGHGSNTIDAAINAMHNREVTHNQQTLIFHPTHAAYVQGILGGKGGIEVYGTVRTYGNKLENHTVWLSLSKQ